ncbi:hypothetical protein H9P43_005748 [Blastocladiella emersonii ATCC 22665]|nr:hypothetical protein H9P43_005748 [Blastocladiella emersonii ATCC 22665]
MRVHAFAYVDNLTLVTPSLEALGEGAAIGSEFSALNGLLANPSKSLVLRAGRTPAAARPLRFSVGGEEVRVLGPKEPARFLGAWFSGDGSNAPTLETVTREALLALAAVAPRHLTARAIVYAINMVIIPRALYRMKAAVPLITRLEQLDAKFRMLVRRKLGASVNLPSAALRAPAALGLRSIVDAVLEQSVTEFTIGLSSPGLVGDTCRVLVALLQQEQWLPSSVTFLGRNIMAPAADSADEVYYVFHVVSGEDGEVEDCTGCANLVSVPDRSPAGMPCGGPPFATKLLGPCLLFARRALPPDTLAPVVRGPAAQLEQLACIMDEAAVPEPAGFAQSVLSLDLAEDAQGIAGGIVYTDGNHSSFRSELWGALAAAASACRGAKLTLTLDNKGVVDSAVKMLSPSPRVRVRATCSLEWAVLRWIIAARELRVSFEWVRGHAGNSGNEEADAPNKQAAAAHLH